LQEIGGHLCPILLAPQVLQKENRSFSGFFNEFLGDLLQIGFLLLLADISFVPLSLKMHYNSSEDLWGNLRRFGDGVEEGIRPAEFRQLFHTQQIAASLENTDLQILQQNQLIQLHHSKQYN